jgi:carboxylesterase
MTATTEMQTRKGLVSSPAFSFIRGPVGCLLVHGFGDTATLMEPMGTYLGNKGISIRGITLPGHGSSLSEFAAISNQQLLGMVEREYVKLSESCNSVVVVGFSMGGLLALQLATLRDVGGLVTICAPVFPRGGRAGEKAMKLAARLGAVVGATFPKMGFTSLSDKTLSDYLTGYTKYPSQSIVRLIELMEATRAVIPRVNARILVVQSSRDDVIWKNSGKHIFDLVGSMEKRIIHLANSRHKAPLDRDRHLLFEEISRFCVNSTMSRPR